MASSTSWQGSSKSLPSTASNDGRPSAPVVSSTSWPRRAGDRSRAVVQELVGGDREDALATLLERRRRAQDQWPGRPRIVLGADVRWLGHDLELMDAEGALAVGRAQAVGPGVATADDDHVLALGGDRGRGQQALPDHVGRLQVVHGPVDAVEVASRHGQITGLGGPPGQHHRVVVGHQVGGREHRRPLGHGPGHVGRGLSRPRRHSGTRRPRPPSGPVGGRGRTSPS